VRCAVPLYTGQSTWATAQPMAMNADKKRSFFMSLAAREERKTVSERLKTDIACFHLHRRIRDAVQLNADFALHFSTRRIVIN
jgi:hypothetical protein